MCNIFTFYLYLHNIFRKKMIIKLDSVLLTLGFFFCFFPFWEKKYLREHLKKNIADKDTHSSVNSVSNNVYIK